MPTIPLSQASAGWDQPWPQQAGRRQCHRGSASTPGLLGRLFGLVTPLLTRESPLCPAIHSVLLFSLLYSLPPNLTCPLVCAFFLAEAFVIKSALHWGDLPFVCPLLSMRGSCCAHCAGPLQNFRDRSASFLLYTICNSPLPQASASLSIPFSFLFFPRCQDQPKLTIFFNFPSR